MKGICLTMPVLFALMTIADAQGKPHQTSEGQTIKVMTYNLKFASPSFKPAWAVRRQWQVDLIEGKF